MIVTRIPVLSRAWIFWFVLLVGGSAWGHAEVPESLAGDWVIVDETPALMHPSNEQTFKIIRALPGKSQWADGTFFLKWPGSPRPDRGYYSLSTGRVWITTYRWVDEKEERVEYQGVVSEDGKVVWSGIGKTTGNRQTSWDFTATKR